MSSLPPTDDDRWLAALLEGDAQRVAADDRFTDAVLARLPNKTPARRKLPFSRRDVALVGFGAVAGAVGAFGFARGTLALDTPAQLIAVAAVIGLGLWAALASSDA